MNIHTNQLKPINTFSIVLNLEKNKDIHVKNLFSTTVIRSDEVCYIDEVETIIDSAGIHNIKTSENVSVDGNNKVINPGYYNVENLTQLLPIDIPMTGENAFYVKAKGSLVFSDNSTLKKILGFKNNTVNVDDISDDVINTTLNDEVVLISSNITSNPSSSNSQPLSVVPLNVVPGAIQTMNTRSKKLVTVNYFDTINIYLHNKKIEPWSIGTDMTVILHFVVYKK